MPGGAGQALGKAIDDPLFQRIAAEFQDLDINFGQFGIQPVTLGHGMLLGFRRGAPGPDSASGELLPLPEENSPFSPQNRDLVDISCHLRFLSVSTTSVAQRR